MGSWILAKSEAVLPAYLVGLVIAGVFVRDRVLMDRMRAIAFTMLTPFYFIKAGLFVSLPAVRTGALLIAGSKEAPELSRALGCVAVTASTINIVSGFLITDRMLKMFRKKDGRKEKRA